MVNRRAPFSTAEESQQMRARRHLLVEAYRCFGHREARLDPLQPHTVTSIPDSTNDSLQSLEEWLKSIYCGNIGVEFEHIEAMEEREWWAHTMEKELHTYSQHTIGERRTAAKLMVQANAFELFVAKRFPGFKRYSGEGAESLYPLLNTLLVGASNVKACENAVIGMPHRGRLATLATLMKHPVEDIMAKIQGHSSMTDLGFVDDVTSHIGARTVIDGLKVTLLNNPSHLEIVGPVSMGNAKAKSDRTRTRSMNIQMHGDAAVVAQGCVHETINFSQLPGFHIGGSIHVVVNNRVGFTTQPETGRSTRYCTDMAKGSNAAILHVNGGDVDSVLTTAKLAISSWKKFGKDVWVDLNCYRRFGHNEVDDPSFTQPLLYGAINELGQEHNPPGTYTRTLINDKVLKESELKTWETQALSHLESEQSKSLDIIKTSKSNASKVKITTDNKGLHGLFGGRWKDMIVPSKHEMSAKCSTGVSQSILKTAIEASVQVPEDFKVHDRLMRTHVLPRKNLSSQLSDKTYKGTDSEVPTFDWSTAEAMAFGSLLSEGKGIRLCGQDSGRGTFSQRHAQLTCQNTGHRYTPLLEWAKGAHTNEKFRLINSPLSELAVLAFEYGYSLDDPNTLVIWEAQFADFGPCAQTVIDQFIASGESKWMRQTGLTLLLPHGLEGGGPEHSSARIERYLQLSSDISYGSSGNENKLPINYSPNIIVAHPSTPASYFHLLRRQLHATYRKPLIIITPKSLLRNPSCVSSITDITEGTAFSPVLGDSVAQSSASRVLFCSGKIYYDLLDKRSKTENSKDTAIIRLEQLTPFPTDEVLVELNRYSSAKSVMWVQEDGANAGAVAYLKPHLESVVSSSNMSANVKLEYRTRPAMATPAMGFAPNNTKQLQELLESCFD